MRTCEKVKSRTHVDVITSKNKFLKFHKKSIYLQQILKEMTKE